MSMHLDSTVLGRAEQTAVEAGKMASFTIGPDIPLHTTPVSLRAAVWLLQSLEGKIESYDPAALVNGDAVRVAYQYGTHKAVLGTFSIYEIDKFLFGMLAYQRRKWKQAVRKARRVERKEAIQKGGASL